VGVLRQAWTEALLLHRAVGLWLPGALAVWVVWLGWQEGNSSIRAPLFWPGLEAALVLTMALLPAVWRLGRQRVATDWILRHSAHPARTVCAQWLAVAGYGTAITAAAGIVSITFGRMFGVTLEARPVAVLVGEALVFGVPTAALAPAVGALRWPPAYLLVVWTGALALSLWRGFPLPTTGILSLQDPSPPQVEFGQAAAASVLATLGGLAVSLALVSKSR